MTAAAQESANTPDTSIIKVHSLAQLLSGSTEERPPLIGNLLKRGDQMILSAAPKTGKSFIAQQIALTMALPFESGKEERYLFSPKNGNKVTPFKIAPPEGKKKAWKVLFFSLEMTAQDITHRLRKQLVAWNIPPSEEPPKDKPAPVKVEDIPLNYCFGLPPPGDTTGPSLLTKSLSILKVSLIYGEPMELTLSEEGQQLHKLIQKIQPDLVIYDTLIQLHSLNENDNVLMKALLQQIRSITYCVRDNTPPEPIAHIVVHHTRKESAGPRGALSPEMMRGAGSVHGTADIVMLARLQENDREKNTVELHVSSRSFNVENFFLTKTKHLTYEWKVLSADEMIGRREQRKRSIREAILQQLNENPTEGVKLDSQVLERAVEKIRDDHKWSFKPGLTAQTVTNHVTEMLHQGTLAFVSQRGTKLKPHWSRNRLKILKPYGSDQPDLPKGSKFAVPKKRTAKTKGQRNSAATRPT